MAETEEKEIATERELDLPIPDILPVLPLKDVVVFPYIILPLSVSREKSINAVDAALAEQRIIMLVAQKEAQNESPRAEELYSVGTVAATGPATRPVSPAVTNSSGPPASDVVSTGLPESMASTVT